MLDGAAHTRQSFGKGALSSPPLPMSQDFPTVLAVPYSCRVYPDE